MELPSEQWLGAGRGRKRIIKLNIFSLRCFFRLYLSAGYEVPSLLAKLIFIMWWCGDVEDVDPVRAVQVWRGSTNQWPADINMEAV